MLVNIFRKYNKNIESIIKLLANIVDIILIMNYILKYGAFHFVQAFPTVQSLLDCWVSALALEIKSEENETLLEASVEEPTTDLVIGVAMDPEMAPKKEGKHSDKDMVDGRNGLAQGPKKKA